MGQELRRDHGADRVAAEVVGPGVAAPVAVEARQRVGAAGLERSSEDVAVGHARSISEPRRQQRRAALVNERRSPTCVHLTSKPSTCAVRRGVLKVERLPRRTLIHAAEIERYRKEVQGTQGWDKRKQSDYTPNTKQRVYQQAYYQRRKAVRQQQPATEPAE